MLTSIPWTLNLSSPDSLSWETVKLIIDSQHKMAIYGITVIVILVGIAISASWLWNFYVNKHKMEETVKSLGMRITAEADKRIQKEIDKVKGEIEKSNEEKIKAFEAKIEKKMIGFDADKARLFALAAQQSKVWDKAAYWWSRAIVGYLLSNKDSLVRIAVDSTYKVLKACEYLEDEDRKAINDSVASIPEILAEEKEQILKRIKELPNKEQKQTETK